MNEASEYVSKAGVLNCTILGGDDLISESAADMLFKNNISHFNIRSDDISECFMVKDDLI